MTKVGEMSRDMCSFNGGFLGELVHVAVLSLFIVCLWIPFSNKMVFLSVLIEMHSTEMKPTKLIQFIAIKATIDVVLIDELLIRVALMVQFMFCLLQCIIQYIQSMSWIIRLIIIQLTIKLIKLTKITISYIQISSNTCKTLDIMTGYDNSLFFQIFSSYVIVIETGLFPNQILILSCICIQLMIKMIVNSSVLRIFNAIYPFTTMTNNILSNTASETIVEKVFQQVYISSKTHTKDNNRPLIMNVNNCIVAVQSKKFIDTSGSNNNNQDIIFFEISHVTKNFFVFVLDTIVLV